MYVYAIYSITYLDIPFANISLAKTSVVSLTLSLRGGQQFVEGAL